MPRAPSSDDDDDDEAAAAPPRPPTGKLDKATVQALRDVKKRFDEGKIDEATFKETKAGLLNKSAPAVAEAPSLVGREVRKRFPGSGMFDGIVESVADGRCEISWSDGAVTSMKESAVAKILKD